MNNSLLSERHERKSLPAFVEDFVAPRNGLPSSIKGLEHEAAVLYRDKSDCSGDLVTGRGTPRRDDLVYQALVSYRGTQDTSGEVRPSGFTKLNRVGANLGLTEGLQYRLQSPSIALHD